MRALAVIAGLTAAVLLPGEPAGIGVTVVAVLVAAAVATRVPRRAEAILFGTLALALAAMPAVRDAGWVVALDLAAAWLAASVAVAGPQLRALVEPVLGAGALPRLAPRPHAESVPMARGAALAGIVVLPFGALFLSADAAFAELWNRVPAPSLEGLLGRWIAFLAVILAAVGLAYARYRPGAPGPRRTRLSPWEWALPLVLLDALFLTFVAVQVIVLFGGHDHVLETAGLTYAEYAHQGFWQLVAAALLTLVVVAGAAELAETPKVAHRRLLRALLAVLCLLTLVLVASVLKRLAVYEDAFGLTRLRLTVDVFTLWLGALFGLLLVAGVSARVRRELPRIVAAGTAAGVLAFTLANPDGLVASRNVDRWEKTGRIDPWYLGGLSADAVPAIANLAEPHRSEALERIAERLGSGDAPGSWNLARTRARAILD